MKIGTKARLAGRHSAELVIRSGEYNERMRERAREREMLVHPEEIFTTRAFLPP
jgi:hypothetical protein